MDRAAPAPPPPPPPHMHGTVRQPIDKRRLFPLFRVEKREEKAQKREKKRRDPYAHEFVAAACYLYAIALDLFYPIHIYSAFALFRIVVSALLLLLAIRSIRAQIAIVLLQREVTTPLLSLSLSLSLDSLSLSLTQRIQTHTPSPLSPLPLSLFSHTA